MKTQKRRPSTSKVRRPTCGAKRAGGRELQKARRRVKRPDPKRIEVREDDPNLSGMAGLIPVAQFHGERGFDAELRDTFGHMKSGPNVVYPMDYQLRLLLDLYMSGQARVFGLEALARDPVLVELAGGAIPSIDVLYDDLKRFDEAENAKLAELMARHGLQALRALSRRKPRFIYIDIDTTVMAVFGSQQGAERGYNPQYRNRPCYHPILARVAETDTIVGALLRPGNTGFGAEDVPTIVAWIEGAREAVGPDCAIHVRVDAAGDCTALIAALERLGVTYFIKARISRDLAEAIARTSAWNTIDVDASKQPTAQGANILFQRKEWDALESRPRVVAIRARERDSGKQIFLPEYENWTVQCWLTNNWVLPIDEIAETYNDRAGLEPLISDLKNNWYVGKVPTADFEANQTAFLLKLLAHNLMREYVLFQRPELSSWRSSWIRSAVIQRPGRVIRSGRKIAVRTTPALAPMLC